MLIRKFKTSYCYKIVYLQDVGPYKHNIRNIERQ